MKNNIFPARMAFGSAELQAVKEVFAYYRRKGEDFGYQGYFEQRYTDAFARYMGGGYADAVCTGTAALFVALAALQLKPGSHVIVSAITDPGTINAIILNQLVPVVVDNAANCYNMGVKEFEERLTDKIRAAVVVHMTGQAAPIDAISKIAKERNIFIIEDCSQAHGARCKGKKVGIFGEAACFSTMYRKNHATGGCGGVIFTRNKCRYNLIRSYADRGKPFFRKDFDAKNAGSFLFPALNLNIDELSCAIGIKSLAKLDATRQKRLSFLLALEKALAGHSKVCTLLGLSGENSPFFQPIWVDVSRLACSKIEFAQAVQKEGINVNPHYQNVVCEWPWVKPYLSDTFVTANALHSRDNTFNLLFNERYGRKELSRILDVLLKIEKRCGKKSD